MFGMYEGAIYKATDVKMLTDVTNILTKIGENILADEFFGQYVGGTLTKTALKKHLGITRATLKNSQEYKTFELLIDARVFYNNLAKTEVDPLNSIRKRLTTTKNPLVDTFYHQFMSKKWSTKILASKLGISKTTAADAKEYEALSSLVQGRMYFHGVAQAKDPDSKSKMKAFLTKLDNDEQAQHNLGQFVAGSLTETALKTELKVSRNIRKDPEEYEAVVLLTQARKLSNTLA